MQLPPVIYDALIDSTETEGYVPGTIETVLRFDPMSRWCAGAIVACSSVHSQAKATRCALLIPRQGKHIQKLALHPTLPADIIKSMLNAY